jgi:hypothetical protein
MPYEVSKSSPDRSNPQSDCPDSDDKNKAVNYMFQSLDSRAATLTHGLEE